MILDDIHDPASISELVNGALTCKYHKWYAATHARKKFHDFSFSVLLKV